MKKLLLALLLFAVPVLAQNPRCVDVTLSIVSRSQFSVGGSTDLSAFSGANFSYRTTGSPATLSLTIEAGNFPVATATPVTKIAAVTTVTSGINVDMGKANGPFRFWWANLGTLTGGTSPTVIVTACFQPNALISLTGSSGVVTGSGTAGQSAVWSGTNAIAATPAVRYADQFAGADACAKIAAAITDLPAAGGTCDARGLEGAQACAATVTVSKPVRILLGATTITASVNPMFSIGDTDGFQLIGSGMDKTTLVAASATGYVINKTATLGGKDDMLLEDLTVSGNATADGGILISGAQQGYYLVRVKITAFTKASTGAALKIAGANTGSFTDSWFHGSTIGVHFDVSGAATSNLNTFRGGVIASNATALLAENGIHIGNEFYGVNFASNTVSPTVWVKRGENWIFEGNWFEGNPGGAGTYSIQLGDTAAADVVLGAQINRNVWNETNEYFVHLRRTEEVSVADNLATGTGATALALLGANAAKSKFINNALSAGVVYSGTADNDTVVFANYNTRNRVSDFSTVSALPSLWMENTASAANNKKWRLVPSGSVLYWQVFNDAESVSQNWLEVTRSGATTTSVVFPNGTVGITGTVSAALYTTASNCADSAGDAACAAAPAGSVVVDAADTATVVSTTAVTANSQIFLQVDASLGTRLSVTCNTQAASVFNPRVTARTAATSFTITVDAGPTTNPLCLSYWIVN